MLPVDRRACRHVQPCAGRLDETKGHHRKLHADRGQKRTKTESAGELDRSRYERSRRRIWRHPKVVTPLMLGGPVSINERWGSLGAAASNPATPDNPLASAVDSFTRRRRGRARANQTGCGRSGYFHPAVTRSVQNGPISRLTYPLPVHNDR